MLVHRASYLFLASLLAPLRDEQLPRRRISVCELWHRESESPSELMDKSEVNFLNFANR